MSRALVNLLSTINVVLAIIIVVVCAFVAPNVIYLPGGAILGAIVGFAVAAIICGTLAALCLIEKHLRLIADDVKQQQKASHASEAQRTLQSHQALGEPAIG